MRLRTLSLMLAASATVILGCVVLPRTPVLRSRVHTVGPPPQAPAHGYCYKQTTGVELVFDSKVAAYLVVGRPHHYFSGRRYLRIRSGVWQVSHHLEHGWARLPVEKVPKRLRSKHAKRKGRPWPRHVPANARH